MATLANIFDRLMATRGFDEAASRVRTEEREEPFALRRFPNDDVFFFAKKIDNSRVVRESDPAAGRICWRMIGSSVAAVVLVIAILLPSVYGHIAGYKIEALRQERQRLEVERAALELEESKMVSPARLEELARKQFFIDPAPQRVVYLEGKPEGTLARR